MSNRTETKETKQNIPALMTTIESMSRGQMPGLLNQLSLEASVDDAGNTPLLWAAKEGRVDLVKFLIEMGANLNAKNTWRQSINDLTSTENIECLSYLLGCQMLDTELVNDINKLIIAAKATAEKILGSSTPSKEVIHERKHESEREQQSGSIKNQASNRDSEQVALIEKMNLLTHRRTVLQQQQSKAPHAKNEKELESLDLFVSQIETHLKVLKEGDSVVESSVSDVKHSSHAATTFHSSPTYMEIDVPGDGDCFYTAVALYVGKSQRQLRNEVADELKKNLEKYKDFLVLKPGQTLKQFIESVRRPRDAWADQVEIRALMHILQRPIIVVRPNQNAQDRARNPDKNQGEDEYFGRGAPILVKYNGYNHYDAIVLIEGQHHPHESAQSPKLSVPSIPFKAAATESKREIKHENEREQKSTSRYPEESSTQSLRLLVLQQISKLQDISIEQLPLMQKIELRATVTSLLAVVGKAEAQEVLLANLCSFLHEREILLADTLWDYCFVPDSPANRICYTIAEQLLPFLTKEYKDKACIYGKMDLLLQKTKIERRPAHAPQWLDTVLQQPELPEHPTQIVRWQGEIHVWEHIIDYACSCLEDKEVEVERIFLKTDNKSTLPLNGVAIAGTSSKPGALPSFIIEMLREKGPACRALVGYVYELLTLVDLTKRFEVLYTGLRAGSIKGEGKDRGTEYVAGASANIALLEFFTWWDTQPQYLKSAIGQLTTDFDSHYSNPELNGRKSINDLLNVLRNPRVGDVRTCVEIISRNLLQILTDNKNVLETIVGRSSRKTKELIEAQQKAAYQEIAKYQPVFIHKPPLALENYFAAAPTTISALLAAKLVTAIRSKDDNSVEEILLNYPDILGAMTGETTIYSLIQSHGSPVAKACATMLRKKKQFHVLQGMIEISDLEGIKKALASSPDLLNATLPNGLTPLAFAVGKSLEVADFLLLQKNIDIFVAEDDLHKSIVDLLLTAANKPEVKPAVIRRMMFNAAALAIRNNKLASLQKMEKQIPALLGCRDSHNNTLLIIAARHGSQRSVEYLLAKGADPFATGEGDKTAHQLVMQNAAEHKESKNTAHQWRRENAARSEVYSCSAVSQLLVKEELNVLQNMIVRGELDGVKTVLTSNPNLLNETLPGGLTPLALAINKSWVIADFLLVSI